MQRQMAGNVEGRDRLVARPLCNKMERAPAGKSSCPARARTFRPTRSRTAVGPL